LRAGWVKSTLFSSARFAKSFFSSVRLAKSFFSSVRFAKLFFSRLCVFQNHFLAECVLLLQNHFLAVCVLQSPWSCVFGKIIF